jgi:hypothetical protein
LAQPRQPKARSGKQDTRRENHLQPSGDQAPKKQKGGPSARRRYTVSRDLFTPRRRKQGPKTLRRDEAEGQGQNAPAGKKEKAPPRDPPARDRRPAPPKRPTDEGKERRGERRGGTPARRARGTDKKPRGERARDGATPHDEAAPGRKQREAARGEPPRPPPKRGGDGGTGSAMGGPRRHLFEFGTLAPGCRPPLSGKAFDRRGVSLVPQSFAGGEHSSRGWNGFDFAGVGVDDRTGWHLQRCLG